MTAPRTTLGWTEAAEKILGRLPAGYSRNTLAQMPKKKREVEAEYGAKIPSRIPPDGEVAHGVADAIMRLYYRAHPGAADAAVAKQRKKAEPRTAAFDRAIQKAIAAISAELQNQFKAQVDARVGEIRDLLQAERVELAEREASIARREKTVNALMSYDDFKLIRGMLHPDRLHTVDPERLHKAFTIFDSLEKNVSPWTPIAELRRQGWEHLKRH